MIPQSVAAVFGAVCARFLQQRHDLVDEVVKAVRRQVRYQNEPVAGVGLQVAVDLVGDVRGSADKLLPAGDGDNELADRQFSASARSR